MEKRVNDAAMEGNVSLLQELLQEDPLILDRLVVSCAFDTPLHIASMLGHFKFVMQLLSLKPELASELDSHGCSALHIAAAKGNSEIVRELLQVNPEMGLVRNQDGRTPLHVAVIKGRVEVVKELVRSETGSVFVLTDRDETALHLSVVANRSEVLKILVEEIGEDKDLVNWKDCDGNTVLHVASAKKQIQIIRFLLSIPGLKANALNSTGLTALDILTQSPRDLRDMEIENLLRQAGALSARNLNLIAPDEGDPARAHQHHSINAEPVVKHKHTDWLGRKRSALMVVASLIATVAFQAGVTPPGGVWQDDLVVDANVNPTAKPHSAGTAIMAYNQPIAYGLFMIFNTLAFLSALSIILLLVSGLPLKQRRWMWIQMVTMWIAITAQVGTYFVALRNMSPNSNNDIVLRKLTEISVMSWLCLVLVVFIGNAARMNMWFLRKYGYIKEEETVPSRTIDEDQEV